ncbi:hypothetical protein CICLE_v10010233mg, partial [Citrus x clementina]
MQLSFAADTVTTATFICDGEKLVSSSQRFELGFSSPGNSKHRCLGIGFKKSPDTVVWLLKAQNLVAQLLDTRNFVLGDNILVSFDCPSDTLLPGIKVVGDLNIVLELYLTSWRIADDPSPGNFSYRLDILIHGVTLNITNYLYEEVLADNEDEIYIRYDSINISSVVILKVNLAGPVTHLIWNVMFSAPGRFCDYPDNASNRECLKGFKLESQDNQMNRINLKRSEADCLKNCTCRAYTDSKLTGGDSGCLMCFGDLIFVRRSLGNFTGQSVYIRVPASEPGIIVAFLKLIQEPLWMTIIVVLLVIVLLAFFFFFSYLVDGGENTKMKSKEAWFPFFSLASISAATDNFSQGNKLGEGGFGDVYKGKLFNGEEVVVERLSSQSGQGQEEFKNEMMCLAL